MKAKTLRGVIAIASATVSISAFANTTNDWFSASATENTAQLVNVSTNGQVEVESSKFVIDNDDNSPLVFTPAVALTATNSTNISKIDVHAIMTASRTNDFKAVDNAHAGFAVGIDDTNTTNYYGYVNGKWINLGGTPVDGAETEFSIVLNYREKTVNFIVNGNDVGVGGYNMIASASTLAGLEAFGTGSISSIDSDYEVAVAAIVTGDTTNRYGSVAEAVSVAGTPTGVQGVSPTGETKTADAKAANGLDYVVCEAMGLPTESTEDATIKLESAKKSNAGKITLAWAKPDSAEDGVTIKFQVMNGNLPVGEPCDWDDIKIPMESGTYTVEPSIQK